MTCGHSRCRCILGWLPAHRQLLCALLSAYRPACLPCPDLPHPKARRGDVTHLPFCLLGLVALLINP